MISWETSVGLLGSLELKKKIACIGQKLEAIVVFCLKNAAWIGWRLFDGVSPHLFQLLHRCGFYLPEFSTQILS
jgi:hypothetical protein